MRRPEVNEPAQAVNDVMREKAYLNGIKYIDITAHFADEAGNYTPYGPDIAGQQRIVREPDGVLFTWARAIASSRYFVEREIKRDLAQARVGALDPAGRRRGASRSASPPCARASPMRSGRKSQPRHRQGGRAGKDTGKASTKTPAGPAADASGETKADNGRISLRTVAAGRPRGDRDPRAAASRDPGRRAAAHHAPGHRRPRLAHGRRRWPTTWAAASCC